MYILYFILGACLGSFYLCILDNYPNFFNHSRSICPYCHNELKFYHLIPILSYIILKGKCAYCKHKVSWRYPIFEIISGITFVLCYQNFTFFIASNIIVLLAISISDIRHGIIYDSLLIILFILIITHYSIDLKLCLFILFIGIFLSINNLIGFGDIKLLAIYSLIFDLYQMCLILFIASLIALIITKKRKIKFAPYLSFAIICILVI